MKVSIYIVVCNWSGLEKHNREFVEWFLDEREAYNKALDLANDSDGTHKYYILIGEREMNIKKRRNTQ